jgi:hypothetical protein
MSRLSLAGLKIALPVFLFLVSRWGDQGELWRPFVNPMRQRHVH